MAKTSVFISYDYANDEHHKIQLVAWDAKEEFDFAFYPASIDAPVDSADATAIKRVIAPRIADATHFLCIVGARTHESPWVAWEIDKAVKLGRKIVGVKTAEENTSPHGLYGVEATWARSFSFAAIKKALDEA